MVKKCESCGESYDDDVPRWNCPKCVKAYLSGVKGLKKKRMPEKGQKKLM